MYVKGGGFIITVEKLKKLLGEIPEGHQLEPSQTGNLLITKDGDSLGFIDIGAAEEVVWFKKRSGRRK